MGDTRATVFIVEDEASCAEVIRRLLERGGYRTRLFGSAEEFLEELDTVWCGCVLLDVMMPGMDGLELQEELNTRGVRLPVVFLTGYGTVERGVEAMKKGARDFLEKPFHGETLLAAVERAMAAGEVEERSRREHEVLAERYSRLSCREREVMDHVVRGLTSVQIGEMLHISDKTVKVHRSRVKAKMQVDSLPELVLAALALGRI